MFDRTVVSHGKATYAFAASVLACTLLLVASGCKRVSDANGPDPAAANLAPVDPNQPSDQTEGYTPAPQQPYRAQAPAPRTRVLGQSQQAQPYQQSETYEQSPAPIERAPDPQNYTPPQQYADAQAYQGFSQNGDQGYDQYDQYAEAAPLPPPPLPVYQQPPAPEPNYLWSPGYWSYAPTGYFWVPGAWCAPPYTGALWTPGYWGYVGDRYRFHHGFWGLHIGFYGGIPYGFGYTGHGYEGGYWRGKDFYYNRSVNRVNETVIHNTYVHNVTINNTIINNRVSYNGPGGAQARPAAYEVAAMREQHAPPQAAQMQIRQQAAGDRQQFYTQNHGQPAVAVAQRPLVADHGVNAPARQQFVQNQNARPEQGSRPGFQQPLQQTPVNGNLRGGNGEQQRFAEQQRNAQQQQEQFRGPQGQRELNTPPHDRQMGTVQMPLQQQQQRDQQAQQRFAEQQQLSTQQQVQSRDRQGQRELNTPPHDRQTGTVQLPLQQQQQREQQLQLQQHTQQDQQLQQRNQQAQKVQQHTQQAQQEAQRQALQQQRTAPVQQSFPQRVPEPQQQQNDRQYQQQMQQRNQPQLQQRFPQQEQRPQPQQQAPQRPPQQQVPQPQRAPQPQQQMQPQAQPHMEAPHAAPVAQPHEERSRR